jgi:hypothetical protein
VRPGNGRAFSYPLNKEQQKIENAYRPFRYVLTIHPPFFCLGLEGYVQSYWSSGSSLSFEKKIVSMSIIFYLCYQEGVDKVRGLMFDSKFGICWTLKLCGWSHRGCCVIDMKKA